MEKRRRNHAPLILEPSDSTYSSSDSDFDLLPEQRTHTYRLNQKYIRRTRTPQKNKAATFDNEIEKKKTVPPIDTKSTQPTLRLLDRYKASTPRASSRLQIIPLNKRVNHFRINREKEWHHATYTTKFRMYSLGEHFISPTKPADPNVPIAMAQYTSTFSQIIKVENQNGVVCEIDTDSDGKYAMKIGCDTTLQIRKEAGDAIIAEFFEVDEIVPPYKRLISPPGICEDLKHAFGDRPVIKSIKNCKMCVDGEEILAIRKVDKNDLEIDAKGTLSFLTCFTISLFMFTQ